MVAQLGPEDVVQGLGFDATCSLVVLDDFMQPLTVDSQSGELLEKLLLYHQYNSINGKLLLIFE